MLSAVHCVQRMSRIAAAHLVEHLLARGTESSLEYVALEFRCLEVLPELGKRGLHTHTEKE